MIDVAHDAEPLQALADRAVRQARGEDGQGYGDMGGHAGGAGESDDAPDDVPF